MKIKSPIVGVFVLILFGISYFLYTSYQNSRQANTASKWVSHTHLVIEKLNNLEASVFELESAVRGFIISGNDGFIERLPEKRASAHRQLSTLKKLIADNPVQQRNATVLEDLVLQKIQFQDEILTTYNKSASEALFLIKNGKGKMLSDSIKTMLALMSKEENNLLSIRTENNNQIIQKKLSSSVTGALVVLILFVIGLFF